VAGLGPKRRIRRETPSYADAFAALGSPEQVDEALLVITEAIARAPEVFNVVHPLTTIRLAKTDPCYLLMVSPLA
jgi:hypothetical protein